LELFSFFSFKVLILATHIGPEFRPVHSTDKGEGEQADMRVHSLPWKSFTADQSVEIHNVGGCNQKQKKWGEDGREMICIPVPLAPDGRILLS
jgi:hypothetical protein